MTVLKTRPRGEETPRPGDPDSRARTHLANERTFLAWLRTGLSLVAVGLATASFLPHDVLPGFPYVTSFSLLLVLAGTGAVLFGATRYSRASSQIDTASYQPAVQPIIIVALIVGVFGVMTMGLVLLLR